MLAIILQSIVLLLSLYHSYVLVYYSVEAIIIKSDKIKGSDVLIVATLWAILYAMSLL